MSLDIIYCDAALLVLNKPGGLLAVPGRGSDKQDSLATRVQAVYPEARIVHRLDMATSGIMLMARGVAMQRELNRRFAQRAIHKQYVAVVHGRISEQAGMIELPVAADWPRRPRQKVDVCHGKVALTTYQALHYDAASNTTRVMLQPYTGRSHQLRVHLQAIGHPIVGDTLYAEGYDQVPGARLLLHACSLEFSHPVNGQPCVFACPPLF